ncbi:MAG: hypothetical protein MJ158_02915 [Alphaproteobacteria bacterium]|nr:hypothetical protein [Alphaproteobacteria bacterium]
MANPHPNMSGLKSFNKMEPEEKFKIQQAGGIAAANEKKRQKTIRECFENFYTSKPPKVLVDQLRQLKFDIDEEDTILDCMIKSIMYKLPEKSTKLITLIRFIDFYAKITGQYPSQNKKY